MRYSIDIETLGRAPNGAIIQIGVAAFDDEGVINSWGFRVTPLPEQALHLDTVGWWLQQAADTGTTPLSLSAKPLSHVLKEDLPLILREPREIWSKPPSFDINMLEWSYRSIGLTPPWHYGVVRCVRTLELMCLDLGHAVPQPLNPQPHDARSDAVAQAEWIIAMRRSLLA